MLIFKDASCNSYNKDHHEPYFRKNFYKLFGFTLPHCNTIDEVLLELPTYELEILKAAMVSGLMEQKVLCMFRFLSKYYLAAIDGTGMATFEDKPCEHCLTKTSKSDISYSVCLILI